MSNLAKLSVALLMNYPPMDILPQNLIRDNAKNSVALNRYKTLIKYISEISPNNEFHIVSEIFRIKTNYVKIVRNNVTFHFLRREPYNFAHLYFYLPGILRIRQLIRRINPDIVIGFGTDEPYGWEAAYCGKPYIIYTQGIINTLVPWLTWSPARKRFIQFMEKKAIAGARGIIAENEFAQRWILSNSLTDAVVTVIPNCLQDFFVNIPTPSEKRKKEIWHIGELSELKDPEAILRSFINVQIPDASLHFAGKGPLEKKLRKMAMATGIADKCNFHGFIPQQKLADFIYNATTLALASHMDSSPNAIIESLAVGTPVIATNVGGIPFIVQDGTDAILIPPGNHEKMASAMRNLLLHPEITHRMGMAGRKRVMAKHSPSQIAQMHFDFYQTIINKKNNSK